jgi:MFS transporter, PPP family, 3-phenylpropionic acid transporter
MHGCSCHGGGFPGQGRSVKANNMSVSLRLSVLYASVFLGLGVHLPFFPVWLKARSFDANEIGSLLALSIGVRILASPVMAGLADRGFAPAKLLAASQAAIVVCFLAMMQAQTYGAMAVLVALAGVFQSSQIALADIATTREMMRDPRLHYGRIRLWGSIAFILGNLGAGFIMDRSSAFVVMPLLAGAALIAGPVAWFGRDLGAHAHSGDEEAGKGSIRIVWSILIATLAAASIGGASHAALYGFGSLHWQANGFDGRFVGALWSLGVLAEILLFMLAGRLRGGIEQAFMMMALAAFFAMLRWIVMAVSVDPVVIVLLQVSHAFSFGIGHLGLIAALNHLVPASARGRAQGFVTAGNALALAGASWLAGRVYETAGAMAFAAMAPLALASLLLIGLAWFLQRRA